MNTSLEDDDSLYSTTSVNCEYEPPPMTNVRFWLVTVFGSTVSFISIVNNIILFYLFISRKQHRMNHNMYLMLLAFFDIFVSTAYICLMSVNVLSDYLQSPMLVRIWYSYMVPMITISHIAMTTSSFLIVAASFERYCLTVNSTHLPFAQKNRKLIAAVAIFLGVISKGTMGLEFQLLEPEECAGLMTAIQMDYRTFVFDTPYHVVWRFWLEQFIQFFVLLLFLPNKANKETFQILFQFQHIVTLLINLRRTFLYIFLIQNEKSNFHATARAATRTLVMVVCCYLISNIINVALTIWEHVDKQTLVTKYIDLYAIAVDLVSLLTTMACACRLPIYLTCQSALRGEVKKMLIIKSVLVYNLHKCLIESSEFHDILNFLL
uniref:G_PROTEIN_RECEP_F1_2 domain-containing protein n=1 Tax=Heterorhabditis bacteriophora TaxID=37862 RepID=A0A1I7XA90_HETBA